MIMHNHISLALNDEDSNNQQYSIATKIPGIAFSTRLGLRLLNCTAHKYPRTIIVISDTNEGGIRTSTYLLATSDASRNALVYQRF
jgi:hypothetical protein